MRSKQRPSLRPLPPLRFPENLPVSARRDAIADAIRRHSVVIVCGETGSGKTTQLPKICALAGRGQAGLIGHTQPRRIAATSVARRIAEEIGSPLGMHVGHKIRFDERIDRGATIKLMTDGILLAETASDPLLRAYDTLIVDEAHERSLNIDFLLGYLKQLLDGPRRDDLKLVVTSATIDAERFARHFGRVTERVDANGQAVIEPAPVVEVSGRLYPVQIRYQGFDDAHRDDDDESDLPSRIDEAIEALWREKPGDVLVFLPGEREIRDVAEHLRRLHARATAARDGSPWSRGPVELLPLYSRLSAAEQQRVFGASNARRVVLATNVAETSLTVPGIRYVIDPGLARVKRYRYRGKVEQLQIEPVSQAAANQRAGRCGRVSDGVCVRLYDEADFHSRPRFSDPEILRSSLAAVILRMKSLRLDDIERFPFVDPPPRKAIADGYALLQELGAVDDRNELTSIGRTLAKLPVDPRVARMLLAANDLGCLREVAIIASALSTQDPRERPLDAQQAADQRHRRFVDEKSDFVSFVKLWDYWSGAQRDRHANGESNRGLAQRLEREFLSVRRLREWADVHEQLLEACRTLKWKANESPAAPEAIHRALLAGLLGNLGTKSPDDAQYLGTHQTKFSIHPGSALAKKPPPWVMAAEMVDTAKLYARTVARIDPAWVERAAAHLIRRSTSDPYWSRASGQAMTLERGTLYGLTVYAQRRVPLAPVDARHARELLIREALVGGQWDTKLPFFVHNRRLVAEIEALEQRIRRPDLLVDERDLFDWYDARVPQDVHSAQALERWWKAASRETPKLLFLSREALLRKDPDTVNAEAFPRAIELHGAAFALEYRFDPGAADDGVTMTVPIAALNLVDASRCEWLVAGMLGDKVQALLKSLPQRLRRPLVPLPEYAAGFVERWRERAGSRALVDAIVDDLAAHRQLRAQPADFRLETLPVHLSMNFRLVDAHGAVLAQARQLAALRAQYGERAKGALQQAFERAALTTPPASAGSTKTADRTAKEDGGAAKRADRTSHALPLGRRFVDWSFGTLPDRIDGAHAAGAGGACLVGYPALVDLGDAVELQVFDDPAQAVASTRAGLARLFTIALKEPLKFFAKNIPGLQRLSLLYAAFGGSDDLRDELVAAVIERTCLVDPLPLDAQAFAARVADARTRINLVGQELARTLAEVLDAWALVQKKLPAARAHAQASEDVQAQLAALLPKRFVSRTPAARFRELARYLTAIAMRLDKLREAPLRDARARAELEPLLARWRRIAQQRRGQPDARVEEVRWLLEELRVSLFAQELRTPVPVSAKRLGKAIDALRA
ncbi:MAG TPA: ATP-dependent RNA helicase HrpA [Zeimonas sp.]